MLEEMWAANEKHHKDLIYSVMIFMSIMNCSYSEIMNMPFKTYNQLLVFKANFEKEKQSKIQQETRRSTQSISSKNY